ncbi:unnamed protein product [Peniophora sp. CBMAI 1063]|nr:unnamed protein product [Peniophora sp. CBMAI 1063]
MFSRTVARGVHTAARVSKTKARASGTGLLVGAVAAAGACATYELVESVHGQNVIHNEAEGRPNAKSALDSAAISTTPTLVSQLDDDGVLRSLGWGTNRSGVLSPDAPQNAEAGSPSPVRYLDNVALRDLALHAHHGAAVDARGDLYQWGAGSHNEKKPLLTLQGKDLIKVQVAENRVFALSKSGKVYVVSTKRNATAGTGGGWFSSPKDGDFVELQPAQKLGWTEKITDISAGTDHLLATTSSGRTFAHAATFKANEYGQLGFRKFDVPSPTSSTDARIHAELTPLAVADPYANSTRVARIISPKLEPLLEGLIKPDSAPPIQERQELDLQPVSESLRGIDDSSIHWSDRLFEIPALRGVKVQQAIAGAKSSYVLTNTGRVLSWGSNEFGQLGLRNVVSGNTVSVPTEVVFGYGARCTNIRAGGALAFFQTIKSDASGIGSVELFACGNGRFGSLGNGIFTSAQGSPVRTRAVSGLVEYSEAHGNLQPISPHALSVSPDGHVLCTLDTASRAGPGGGGRDLLAWGNNYERQLGNGKRSSVAVPENVHVTPGGPRYVLRSTKAKEVRDLAGRVWGRGVKVEQVALAGVGNSVVYWKLV